MAHSDSTITSPRSEDLQRSFCELAHDPGPTNQVVEVSMSSTCKIAENTCRAAMGLSSRARLTLADPLGRPLPHGDERLDPAPKYVRYGPGSGFRQETHTAARLRAFDPDRGYR
jgi:hypothetical protein